MDFKRASIHALRTGVIAFLLLGPITGLILQGFAIDFELTRPIELSCGLALIQFVWTLLFSTSKGQKLAERFNASKYKHTQVGQPGDQKRWWLWLVFFAALSMPLLLNKYWLGVAILALIYVLLGLGLNIVVGLAGLLDLGFVAFYAVGAYSYALGAAYFDLSFWVALPMAALLAGCFGAILGFPVLRMHGDYLAIVTLGFGEIIRLVLNNWVSLTGGPNGMSAPAPTLFGLEFSRRAKQGGTPFHEYFGLSYQSELQYVFIYCILFLVVCLALRFVTRLHRMPIGRAWEALREDEIACRSLGINHVTTKLSAFSLGAMIGGIGGVFFAAFQGFINPSSFTFIESAIILAIVVLGGMGSTLGVVVAAIVLTLLPELLREFSHYRMFVFGSLMVLMMIMRPRGLVRVTRQWFSRPT